MSTEHPTGSDPIPSTSSSSNSSFEERRQLFLTGANSDVTIVVKRTTTFKAHKAILASRSPVFAAIFADGEYSINQENCVNIGDVDPVIFKELLRYIYTDRVRQWATIAKELYIAADKYHVKCLKELLIEGLSKTLTPKNFAEVFLFADSNGIFDLKKYCLMFFIRDHQLILETEDWDAPLFDENLALLDKIVEVLSEMVLRRGKCCEKQCLEFALHVCGYLGEQKVRRRYYLSAIAPEASRRRGDEPEDEDENDPLQQLQRRVQMLFLSLRT